MQSIDLSARFLKSSEYRVSTGIIALDRVIGGGIPSGRLTEFYGGESTAKSRLCAHIITETQKTGGVAVLNDTEKALHQGLIDLTGVNMEELLYPDPEEITSVEDIFESLKKAIEIIRPEFPDKPITFIWDSVAATPMEEDFKKHIGRPEGAMHRAKLISDGLKKCLSDVYKKDIVLIFVNQIQDKMNVMFGDQTSTPGGRQIKFLASLRLGMKVVGSIKDDNTKEQVGTKIQLLVKKSKVAPPFRIVNLDVPVFEPIDKYSGLLDFMTRHSEVIQSGGWYHFPDDEKTKFRATDFPKAYEDKFGEK